jgi:hypothetical protein
MVAAPREEGPELNAKVLCRPVVVASAVSAAASFALWQLAGEGTALFAFALALVGLPLSVRIARDQLAPAETLDPSVHAHQLRRSIALGAVFAVAALAALFALDPSRSGFALFLPAFFFVWFATLAARCLYAAVWIHRRQP